jgi:conjugal transfer/entry exclusion protein
MKNVRRKAILALGVSVLAIATLRAQFFGGITVFDPTNWMENLRQLTQMQQQLTQLIQTYQQITNQYNHMRRMAQVVPVNMAARYRALLTPWRASTATNTYGTTGGWIGAVNSGVGTAAGYLQSAEQLLAYGGALGNVPAGQLDRLKKNYATVELTDGANVHTIETVGRLRTNAPQVEATIAGLEDDSLSLDPDMNTEIAVLNKINAANIIALRNTQDTNKVLVTLAEHQAVEAKRQRDSEAHAINSHIRFLADEQAILSSQKANATAAMLAFRMP